MIRVATLRCEHRRKLVAAAFEDEDAGSQQKAEAAVERMMAVVFEAMRSGELGKMCPVCYARVRDDVEAGHPGALVLDGTVEQTGYASVAEASARMGGTDVTAQLRQAQKARWN